MDDFHLHTSITDGKMTPEEIIELARKYNLKTIAFTEHIRKQSTYNWFEFRDKIRSLNTYGIKVLVGVEAKVLDENGTLDVDDDVAKAADIVLGSDHSKEGNLVEWLLKSKCDVIAHPQITVNNVDKFINCGKVLEINSKYRLPYSILDKLIVGTSNVFSFGSDSHEQGDFARAQEYFAKIAEKYKHLKITDQGYFNKSNY